MLSASRSLRFVRPALRAALVLVSVTAVPGFARAFTVQATFDVAVQTDRHLAARLAPAPDTKTSRPASSRRAPTTFGRRATTT
jgi:hypothetical protein